MKTPIQIPDPSESWALVELHRWQYGGLPKPDDMRPVSVPAGLRGMAKAMRGPQSGWPAPFNIVSVLEYAAKLMEEKEDTTPKSSPPKNATRWP